VLDFLHLDKLELAVQQYGIWIYLILGTIIFLESAFVIFPFLPGDSLLFAAGVACGRGLDMWIIFLILPIAGVIGNDINYRLGKALGHKLFSKPKSKFFTPENLEKTHGFFEKHGPKAIVLARFTPFVRSFAPFVAGMGEMSYRKFTLFSIIGAYVWIVFFTLIGYFFGEIPWVKKNLELAVIIVITVTLLPIFIEVWRHRRAGKRAHAKRAADEKAQS
jgi:membrane-associated protein